MELSGAKAECFPLWDGGSTNRTDFLAARNFDNLPVLDLRCSRCFTEQGPTLQRGFARQWQDMPLVMALYGPAKERPGA
jgi:hypothetical protein